MAHIDVLTARPIGTVDRRIFGGVAEHLGRCVQGGLIAEEPPGGFRADVLAAVRDLGVTNVRWPLDAAPGGEEPGRFGTGDFLAWCAVAAVEPVLGLNMDTGTLDEALAWVEYCNGSGDSHWARRRRADGHAEPFGIRYWGLGHQMHRRRTAAEYVTEASAVGLGAQAARPRHPADQQRPDRDGRLGPRRHRRPGPARRHARHPPVHRLGGLLVQRPRAALRRTGAVGRRRAHRPGPLPAARRARDRRGLRRVERVVPGRGRAARGALHPGRRPGRRDLAQCVRAPVLDRADGQPGPAGQRARAHRHLPRTGCSARLSTIRSS